jgi:response regulator RpfG family c-di-GMP phosphodiesterase
MLACKTRPKALIQEGSDAEVERDLVLTAMEPADVVRVELEEEIARGKDFRQVLMGHETLSNDAGSSYPDGLSGDGISLSSRIAAVCDVYTPPSDRPYKDAWQPVHARRKMTEWGSGHFDTRISYAFVRTVGIYPIGTLVRLKSERLGNEILGHR